MTSWASSSRIWWSRSGRLANTTVIWRSSADHSSCPATIEASMALGTYGATRAAGAPAPARAVGPPGPGPAGATGGWAGAGWPPGTRSARSRAAGESTTWPGRARSAAPVVSGTAAPATSSSRRSRSPPMSRTTTSPAPTPIRRARGSRWAAANRPRAACMASAQPADAATAAARSRPGSGPAAGQQASSASPANLSTSPPVPQISSSSGWNAPSSSPRSRSAPSGPRASRSVMAVNPEMSASSNAPTVRSACACPAPCGSSTSLRTSRSGRKLASAPASVATAISSPSCRRPTARPPVHRIWELGGRRLPGLRVGGGLEDHVELRVAEGGLDPVGGRLVGVVDGGEVPDQGLLDREHGVGVQVRAAGHEHVGGDREVAVGGDDEVDVGRPVGMAAGGRQEPAHRAVGGDRVGARGDRAEPEAAVAVAGEKAPAVPLRLGAGLLDVVEAVVVGLPDVDQGAGQGGAVQGADLAGDHAGLAGGDQVDGVAQLAAGRGDHVERPEHGRVGRHRRRPVVDGVDQHGHPEHVREQDELLAGVVALLPGGGQEPDGPLPLLEGRLDLAHEPVQVPDQAAQDLPEPRIGRPSKLATTAGVAVSSVKSMPAPPRSSAGGEISEHH